MTPGKGKLSPNAPYALVSTRPLHVLIFLLPLMVAYELGSIFYLSGTAQGANTIGARNLLGLFFDAFGAASLHVPPIALTVVLLAWHVLLKDGWRLRPGVLAGMMLESCVWAVPLLVFSLVLAQGTPAAAFELAGLPTMSWQARLTVALGAGIYEELVFRLMMITLAHLVLADVFRVPDRGAFVAASLVSAAAFALHHNVRSVDGSFDVPKFLFLAVAGLYFAGIFITRGFGLVVAVHALYDVVALLAFPRS